MFQNEFVKALNQTFHEGNKKSDFDFIEKLGQGAFGKVYKVTSKISNNKYAIKVLSKKQLNQ